MGPTPPQSAALGPASGGKVRLWTMRLDLHPDVPDTTEGTYQWTDRATGSKKDTTSTDGMAALVFSVAPSNDDVNDNVSPANMSDPYWDQLPFAHKYWRQFNIAGIPDGYHHAVAFWMAFFGIVGVLGNLLVITTFVRGRHLRTPHNMLIVNMAASDLGFSAVNGFPCIISSIKKIWPWGQVCCQLYGFSGGLCGFVSIHTLALIAYDRYSVVTRPLEMHTRNLSKKNTRLPIVLVWLWCLGWALPPLFGWGAYVTEGFHTSCSFDYLTHDLNNTTYVIGVYVFNFVVPVSIITVCYTGIMRGIFKHNDEMHMLATLQSKRDTVSKRDAQKQQEILSAKVAATSVGAFLLSWAPYATVGLIGMVYPHEDKMVTPYMSGIPVMFAKASAAYNPIIYALSHPSFRVEIAKTFPWLLCCRKPTTVQM